MTKGIFIAGTGTDIGKTYITALFIEKLKSFGIKAGYYKAAISGGLGDAAYVCQQARLAENPRDLISYVYETPVSPHLAANLENNQIYLETIKKDFQRIKDTYDYITVEGAGGLICPLKVTEEEIIMQLDVIKALDLDVVLCTSSTLGTINNTLLTTFYAKEHHISIKGIIMNHFEKDNYLHEDNRKMIEELTKIPVIACIAKDSDLETITYEEITTIYGDV